MLAEMLEMNELHQGYQDMYRELRRYIWSYDTVVALANLEVEVFRAIPNISDIRRAFSVLQSYIRSCSIDDDDLSKSLDNFNTLIYSSDTVYNKIMKVQEVVTQ